MSEAIEHDQADPFKEHEHGTLQCHMTLLGGKFEFRSKSEALLALVAHAYAGLPAQRLGAEAPQFLIDLQLSEGEEISGATEPLLARMQGGAGMFGAIMDAANLAIVNPSTRKGLVSISQQLLRFPYHARYELLEFAVFILASRAQHLIPLHAGCVGLNGAGALLVGESGAGKSTLSLHCMLQGMDFLTEDASFVEPKQMLVTGVPNFLHLREDSLPFIDAGSLADWVRQSPIIRRRSGVEKFELDLRHAQGRVAPTALKLSRIVFVSKEDAVGSEILRPLESHELLPRLASKQPYAVQQAGWGSFAENLSHVKAYELRRGSHPREAAAAVRELLQIGAPSS